MDEVNLRLTEQGTPPTPEKLKSWIGERAFEFWQSVTAMIERNYPGIFVHEWLYGGKKHGWSVRYKKGKSVCTLIPEKNRFALVIVFGAKERAQVEVMREKLSARTRWEYNQATTYHDGKWLLIDVDSREILADVELLLSVKRKPK
ncbi:MAG: DUF3788 domain-containing protein [Smithella sp.]